MFARFVLGWRPFNKGLPWIYTTIGICFLTFPIVLTIEVVRHSPFFLPGYEAVIALVCTGIVALYSIWGANHLRVKTVQVDSQGQLAGKSIVQISDVHIGSRSKHFLESVMDKVNQLDPTWLVVTGDLIDSHRTGSNELKPLQSGERTKLMVVGNHERYEGLDHVSQLISETGVTLLRNESFSEDGVQFVGVDDNDNPEFLRSQLNRIEPDNNLFKILLYHRPHGIEAAAAWGFDLMLSGHTHRGQIFPFSAVVRRYFRLIHGTHHIDNMTLHISMGTGTWGPILRLGSQSEVTQIVFT